MYFAIVIAVFGLGGIGGQQNAGLWRTVDFLGKNRLFDLQKEHAQRNVLDDLLAHVFGKVFGAEFELEWTLLGNVLTQHFLVEFEPGDEALGVLVLQAKVPNLSQANRFDHLVKQLLASCRMLNGKLQLSIHGDNAHINWFGWHF